MISILIIDDEPLARNLIKEYLAMHAEYSVIGECENGFEGIKAIQHLKPDMVFLDIQMPKLSGFEMLELLDPPIPKFVFTTAFDAYALKAFDVNAIDYLLKPISKERFDKALQKLQNSETEFESVPDFSDLKKQPETRIVVKHNSEIKIIPSREIDYLEAYDDYIKIYTANSCFLKKQTMSYYENNLDKTTFARIHRSFIINLSFLDKLDQEAKETWKAVMKSGIKLPVSRSGLATIKSKLGL